MLMPSIFGEDLFDELFDSRFGNDVERKLYGHRAPNEMKTDVKELEDHYELFIDLPGLKKDEIKLSLNDGYLTVAIEKGLNKDVDDKESGKIIRQERYYGTMSRSYYVGENVNESDVKASFDSGVLKITVPKENKAIETGKYIEIE